MKSCKEEIADPSTALHRVIVEVKIRASPSTALS